MDTTCRCIFKQRRGFGAASSSQGEDQLSILTARKVDRAHLLQYLNELATLYFGFPPPRGQAANPLGDIMSSLFGGGGPTSAAGPRVLTPAPQSAGLD